ncbi:MAG: hypothetical protein A2X85_16585 [Geobacteraceae bacterium GWF2_54_21]|nr:MAG: hypothetical protein A2X85_16585 [Geobacteraceae bacterium GWF2_54_21]
MGGGTKCFIYDVVTVGELMLWGCSLVDRKIAKNGPSGVPCGASNKCKQTNNRMSLWGCFNEEAYQ